MKKLVTVMVVTQYPSVDGVRFSTLCTEWVTVQESRLVPETRDFTKQDKFITWALADVKSNSSCITDEKEYW